MKPMVRVMRGVWRPQSQLDDLLGRAAAVLAGCPDGSVLAGVTASRLYGQWLPPWLQHDDLPIEVIVHPDTTSLVARPGSRRREVRARRQRLDRGDRTSFAGLPIVTEAKAWIDVAARLTEPDLLAVGDSALRGDACRDALADVVRRARHCRGVVRARHVLPLVDAAARSRPESHLRYALVSHGLPKPAVNKPIFSRDGEWLAEPDLSYEEARLALEYNGREHASIDRMRRDITRVDDLDLRGDWTVLTFGPAQVFGRPDIVVARVRKHLRGTWPPR